MLSAPCVIYITLTFKYPYRNKPQEPSSPEALYDTYAPTLLSLCIRYCGNREDAEDVLHDGFIKIIRNIDSFRARQPGSLAAWMKRIMINTSLNFLRSKRKEFKIFATNLTTEPGDLTDDAEDHEDEPFLIFDPDEVLRLICQLPAGYRTVFNLYVFEEFSHKEIAGELGISENTSKSQLSKARAMLRKQINGQQSNKQENHHEKQV